MLYVWKKFIQNDLRDLSGEIASLAKKNSIAVNSDINYVHDVIMIVLSRSHPLYPVVNKTMEVRMYDTQRMEVSWLDTNGTRLSTFSAYEVDELAKTVLAILLSHPLNVSV